MYGLRYHSLDHVIRLHHERKSFSGLPDMVHTESKIKRRIQKLDSRRLDSVSSDFFHRKGYNFHGQLHHLDVIHSLGSKSRRVGPKHERVPHGRNSQPTRDFQSFPLFDGRLAIASIQRTSVLTFIHH